MRKFGSVLRGAERDRNKRQRYTDEKVQTKRETDKKRQIEEGLNRENERSGRHKEREIHADEKGQKKERRIYRDKERKNDTR